MHAAKVAGSNKCGYCHSAKDTKHTFKASDNFASCKVCHGGAAKIGDIQMAHKDDYDGDGKKEVLADELHGMADLLFAEMQKVAKAAKAPLCYSSSAYPYFFKDTNDNGKCDGKEGIYPNKYAAWTAGLVKAAHNYQTWKKDHGAWAHNFAYMAQGLYDAIADLKGDVSKLKRP